MLTKTSRSPCRHKKSLVDKSFLKINDFHFYTVLSFRHQICQNTHCCKAVVAKINVYRLIVSISFDYVQINSFWHVCPQQLLHRRRLRHICPQHLYCTGVGCGTSDLSTYITHSSAAECLSSAPILHTRRLRNGCPRHLLHRRRLRQGQTIWWTNEASNQCPRDAGLLNITYFL